MKTATHPLRGSREFCSKLSPDELDRIAAPFEQELVPTKPLTPAMRAQDRRAKRGRPTIGEGSEKVLVTVERGLLREADCYSKTHGLNRSQLISEALRAILAGKPRRKAS